MLQVNEKKAREDLKAQGEMSTELDRRRLEEEGQASGRRREAESHLESWRARQRHLAEDLRFVRAEARDRREQRGKLEAKYEVLSKSLGGGKGGEEEQSKDHVGKTTEIYTYRFFLKKVVSLLCSRPQPMRSTWFGWLRRRPNFLRRRKSSVVG